jgi:hypothetical protein
MHPVRVFVSHSFSDIHYEAGLTSFRAILTEAFDRACQRLAPPLRSSITLDIFYDTRSYGTEISTTVLDKIRSADIFVVDITGGKENVLYELGYAHATGADLLIIKNRSLEDAAQRELTELIDTHTQREKLALGVAFARQYAGRPQVPSDLSGILVGTYTSSADLPTALETRLVELLGTIAFEVKQGTYSHRPRCFWFPETTRTIHIICSPEPEETRGTFASKLSDNFISIDNFEDRDSVLELGMHLSRSFPAAEICIHASNNLGTHIDRENLVIVGGPLNNLQARQFMKRLAIPIDYHLGEQLDTVDFAPPKTTLQRLALLARQLRRRLAIPDDSHLSEQPEIVDFSPPQSTLQRLAIQRDAANLVIRDVGYFGWFRNPLKTDNRVVLCQGYQTWGTVAATRILADTTNGRRNRSYLMGRMHQLGLSDFDRLTSVQAFFAVEVMEDRSPETPLLSDDIPAFLVSLDT